MLFHRVAEKASLIGCTDDLVAAVVARQPKVGNFKEVKSFTSSNQRCNNNILKERRTAFSKNYCTPLLV